MLSSFWQLIEQAWNLYGKHYRTYLPGVFVLFVIAFITPLFRFLYAPSVAALSEQPLNIFITYAILVFVLSLISLYISFTLLRIIYASITQKQARWKDELMITARHFIPAFVVALIIMLATVVGALIVIIPGLILFVFLFFSQYYVLFEGDSIVESLKKGWHLVRGRWFAVAIRLLIPIILIGILQILLDEILQYLIVDNLFTGPREAATMLMPVLVSGGLRALTTSFFYPWLYGATILLYLELKRTPHI